MTEPTRGEDQDTAMRRRFGWRSSDGARCPRTVAGLRCLAFRTGYTCLCRPFYSTLFDHGRLWWDPATKQHVLTGEPYDFDAKDLEPFIAAAAAVGLRFTIEVSNDSPWNPGSTTLVIVRRA